MKRRNITVFIILFIISVMSVSAQRDSDNDGLADGNDRCPQQAGPRTNGGCPELDIAPNPPQPTTPPDNGGNEQPPSSQPDPDEPTPEPPTSPDPNDPTPLPPTFPDPNDPTPLPPTFPDPNDPTPDPDDPFIPPGLPEDGCYVTPSIPGGVNVRNAPMLSGAIIGSLFPNKVYEAKGYVLMDAEIWIMLSTYEGSTGTIGYSSRSVLNISDCEELRAVSTEPSEDRAAMEVDIPDGCWISGIEDGRIIVSCIDAQGTYTVGKPNTGDPAYPNRGGVIDKLVFCNPGDIWWIDFKEPGPGEGICMNTIAEMRDIELQPDTTRLVAIVPDEDEPTAALPQGVWEDLLAQMCYPLDWISWEEDGVWTGECWDSTADTGGGEGTQIGLSLELPDPEPPVFEKFIGQSDDNSSGDLSESKLCGPDQLVFATWLEDEDGNVIEGSADVECVDSDFFD